mgnify:CR=1 FL=1
MSNADNNANYKIKKNKRKKKISDSVADSSENKQNEIHIQPPPTLTRKQKFEYGDAVKYFQNKLIKDPKMSRYNHCLGALYTEAGDFKSADSYYKNALTSAASNVMIMHYTLVDMDILKMLLMN